MPIHTFRASHSVSHQPVCVCTLNWVMLAANGACVQDEDKTVSMRSTLQRVQQGLTATSRSASTLERAGESPPCSIKGD